MGSLNNLGETLLTVIITAITVLGIMKSLSNNKPYKARHYYRRRKLAPITTDIVPVDPWLHTQDTEII